MTFRDEWAAQQFPTCDPPCGQPAVWDEVHGWLHASEEQPRGIAPDADLTGHRPSMQRWQGSLQHTCRRPCRACQQEAAARAAAAGSVQVAPAAATTSPVYGR